MAQHHPLWRAGRARGIQDVTGRICCGVGWRGLAVAGQSVECQRCGAQRTISRGEQGNVFQARIVFAAALRFPAWHQFIEDGAIVIVAKGIHRDQHGAIGLRQQIAQFIAPVLHIDRYGHGPHARNGKFDRDKRRIIGHDQRHMITFAHAARAQPDRKAVRPVGNFGVSPGSGVSDDIGPIGMGLCDLVEHFIETTGLPFGKAGGERGLSRHGRGAGHCTNPACNILAFRMAQAWEGWFQMSTKTLIKKRVRMRNCTKIVHRRH